MRWSYTVMLGEVGYSGPLVGWLRLPAKAELRQWPELSMAAPAGRFLAEGINVAVLTFHCPVPPPVIH